MKRLTVRVTDELHKAAKLKAVEQETTITAIVVAALQRFVEDRNEENLEPAEMCQAMVA